MAERLVLTNVFEILKIFEHWIHLRAKQGYTHGHFFNILNMEESVKIYNVLGESKAILSSAK